jgi:hypothetical protein
MRSTATASLLLLGLTVVAATPGGPIVFLNHFYVVVDSDTYEAMQQSTFVTQTFAPFEKRTTVRNDKTYTGIYWYGRHTYFELFEPGAQGPRGASGIAFGADAPGGGAAVKRLWAEALGGADSSRITRRTDNADVPWFEMTYVPGPEGPSELSALRTWFMEYDREFLARFYPALTPARSITRADVLDRYVAKIGQGNRRAEFRLKDVTELTVALADGDLEALRKEVQSAGWTVTSEPAALVCLGPEGVRLRVVASSPAEAGIREARFSLQGSGDLMEHRLGSAVLSIDSTSARLRFGPSSFPQ